MARPGDGYPQKSCREGVPAEHNMYTCEIKSKDGEHRGPHFNYSSKPSVQARKAWENANPDEDHVL